MGEEGGDGSDTGTGTIGGEATAPPRRPRPKVIALPVKRELSAPHLEQLRASGLDDETIRLAELYTEPNPRVLSTILDRSYVRGCGPALVFPFYLPGAAEPHAYRIKPTNPRVEKKRGKSRQIKYDQSSQAGVLVYFPPRARASGAYADVAQPCYWTEGEKKALAFDQLGYVCVGLTGVWNWSDPAERDATGGDRLHPAIRAHVPVAGREHVIGFDADARDNKQVMHAACRFGGLLLAGGATRVRFVCPPSADHKGFDDYLAAHGPDAMRALLATAEEVEAVDPKRPRPRIRQIKAFADAPVHKEASIPDGFDLRDDGSLWKLSTSEKSPDIRVSRAPLLIQRRFIDHDTGEARAEVCYRQSEEWVSREISQLAIGDPRTMVAELTPFATPITAMNAGKMVEWLHDYEGLNDEYISKTMSLSRVGWHRPAPPAPPMFVLDQPIAPEGAQVEIVVDQRGHRKEIFAALRPHGDFDGHVAGLQRAWAASPLCAAMVCGALAAPLLEPLHAPNFAIHLIGESSRGKTSMLKVAASVYGDPGNPRWLAAWNATNVGTELRAAALCDLPQCYDEVGGGDPEQLQRMIYSIINGTGRTRGQRDATMRETPNWRTIVLSTGERELFGALGAADIDTLCEQCAAHAGSFGRAWVEMLIGVGEWGEWRRVYAEYIAFFRQEAADQLQGRVAAYFALLQVAEQMAWELELSERGSHVMLDLFRAIGSRFAIESMPERARRAVLDWVESEPDAFPELTPGPHGEVGTPPRAGLRVHGYRRIDGTLLMIPSQFREFAKRHGFSAREVVRQWLARGWTDVDPGRYEKRQRVNAKQSRFTILRPEPEDAQ
jgi:hypothetical protein